MITVDDLYKIAPNAKYSKYDIEELCEEMNEVFAIQRNFFRDISTTKRRAAFISQCAYETMEFRRLAENLNYSEKGLLTVFPKYFTPRQAKEYARNPERIANRVYANRLGNGGEISGDGWKYRGRGLIQLTGKYHYRMCSDFLELDLLSNPELLETPKGAVRSAYFYWQGRPDLNIYAEQNMVYRVTEIINGGTRGLEERTKLFNKALEVLG